MTTKVKINNAIDLHDAIMKHSSKIPFEALQDIQKRIGDWTSSGGSLDDPYIHQQYRYIEHLINYSNNK